MAIAIKNRSVLTSVHFVVHSFFGFFLLTQDQRGTSVLLPVTALPTEL